MNLIYKEHTSNFSKIAFLPTVAPQLFDFIEAHPAAIAFWRLFPKVPADEANDAPHSLLEGKLYS